MKYEAYELDTIEYLKKLTILCVEDNKTTQLLYESICEDLVKEIIFADDGEDGYQKFLQHNVDVILSDYEMPKLNGLDMIAKIRQSNEVIPIIFISAIDTVEIFVSALGLNVSSFIQKPIQKKEFLKSLEETAKVLIANKAIDKQKKEALYKSYQEDLGFAKELNILRNDFYYQMIDSSATCLVDFLYQPLDVLSGDAYSARKISEDSTFYLMIDGMGKGISASLTAMIMTSFINHVIDKMLELDSFDLSVLIHESKEYIKPILLDEEALALDYILIDNEDKMIYYAKFAMPALLMENNNCEIVRLKSNNTPLSKWQDTFVMDSYDISKIKKFLIYSDGVVENETIFEDRPYAYFIEEDFLSSFTREELKENFFQKIKEQEDDITLIYIHNLNFEASELSQKVFATSLEEVGQANEWYETIWEEITSDSTSSYKAGLTFTELYMNAFEHGNLGINSQEKHDSLECDEYFESLVSKSAECSKKIHVKVDKIEHKDCFYIITQITDEGDGFDTQILSEIFRNSKTFNGRGVFVSRKNSLGIYYNSNGNRVLYLNKIEKS